MCETLLELTDETYAYSQLLNRIVQNASGNAFEKFIIIEDGLINPRRMFYQLELFRNLARIEGGSFLWIFLQQRPRVLPDWVPCIWT